MDKRMGLAVAVAAVLLGGKAFAGEGTDGKRSQKGMDPEARYAKMDADDSGSVTRDEFMEAHKQWGQKKAERRGKGDDAEAKFAQRSEKLGERFSDLDKDGDGTLSQAEFVAGAPKPGEGRPRGQKKGHGGGPGREGPEGEGSDEAAE